MLAIKLVNQKTNQVIAENVQVAYSFWRRFKGLMLTKSMPENTALHIKPCVSIHTFFMKYNIDIVYLNKKNEIVGWEKDLAPGKFGKRFPGAYSVVEFPAGWVSTLRIEVGQAVDFVGRENVG